MGSKGIPSIKHARALLPDILAIPASDLRIQNVEVNGRNVALLRFSQAFGNIGRGPLQVRRGNSDRNCPGAGRASGYQDVFMSDGTRRSVRLKECMIYHPQHRHWHIANVAKYELFAEDSSTGRAGARVASSDKISFCLFDEHRLSTTQYSGPSYRSRYTTCTTRTTGITPGWADEYSHRVYGQWINITGLRDGIYYMKTTVNPTKIFLETTSRNNVAWKKIRIYDNGQRVSVLPL
jgi:hypothetical protein